MEKYQNMNRFTYLTICCCLIASSLQAQTLNTLKVYEAQEGNSVFIYADNDQLFPQSVKVTLSLKGLKAKAKDQEYSVVPGGSKKFILEELVIPEDRSWGYKYNYTYNIGDVYAKHDDDFAYRLPYEAGKTVRVVQGYNGPESHTGENAIDFDLKEGETVMAARGGLVIRIKEDSNRGCGSSDCARLGNYVSILHSDGTIADYYHLQQHGALVNPGDTVTAGQAIGKAGNTGWATGAHLHFNVYKPGLEKRETLETKFDTGATLPELLKDDQSYTARN